MQSETLQAAKFLIVDDTPSNIFTLEAMLEHWGCFNIQSTTDSRQTLSLYTTFQPDIILLDLMMPHLDGYQVMEQLASLIPEGSYLPILVLTADTSTQTKRKALAAGAKDFLTKPFDVTELSLRICNLLEMRFLHLSLQNQNQLLEERVRERTNELEKTQIETIECLALAAEYRDDDTGQHTQRVAQMATLVAHHLGLPGAPVDLIRRAAPLHDIGKIGIADNILLKPGKLTPEEFALMKTHTTIGFSILSQHHTPLLQLAANIALTHHERWDGLGYPQGLKEEEIPLAGRIIAIVDVFDALTNERPYKNAWPVAEAIAEIKRQSGQQFDPQVVEAFLALPHESLVDIQSSSSHLEIAQEEPATARSAIKGRQAVTKPITDIETLEAMLPAGVL